MTAHQTGYFTPEAEAEAALAIEAGVLAAQALSEGLPVDATADELEALITLGELARDRLLAAHSRAVRFIVNHELRGPSSRADMEQEGWLALAEAVPRFDYRRGRFLTYAMTGVRAAVRAAVAREQGLSERQARGLRRIRETESHLTQQLGRRPLADEVAASLDRDVRWLTWCGVRGSATAPELLNELPAPEAAPGVDRGGLPDRIPAHRLFATLPSMERTVMAGRFPAQGSPVSYGELALRLDVSSSTVRRIEQRALARLRDLLTQTQLAAA